MAKNFYFMAGLPRSGSTLLTALLNQNPTVYASPISPLLNAMGNTYNFYNDMSNKDVDRTADIYNMIDAMPESYYKNYKQQNIVDKNFHWTKDIPYVILQKHIANGVKIICPVRDVLEILASFNKLAENDKNNTADAAVLEFDKSNLPIADKRAKFWMENPHSDILNALSSMRRAEATEFRKTIHFVEYNDLVNDTQETMNKIYDFMGIPRFEQDLTNIENKHKHNDVFGLKDHHKVRSTISNQGDNPADVFLPQTITKYSNLEFWRNL